jgi:hypothetical protein
MSELVWRARYTCLGFWAESALIAAFILLLLAVFAR